MLTEALARDGTATDDAMTSDTEPPAFRRFWLAALGISALCELLLCTAMHQSIAGLTFKDTDDHMRLQQVRDWIAGQSWFDVTQYRMNPPTGMLMHWSRLLDVPLAAVILAVRPFAGQHVAEIAACVVVPMITLAICMLLVAAIARRQVGSHFALLAVPACAFNIGAFYALRPMRIDHHGWQIAAGLAIAWALIDRASVRRAALAGVAAAFWIHVSLEGTVFTALAGGWLGLRWILRPGEEGYRLPAFLAALAGASLVLFCAAHGGALFDLTFCDAVSPVHIAVFALAAAGAAITVRCAPSTLSQRAVPLALTALACGALYRLWAPQCLDGPFATMSPLVYRQWYVNVKEGMPLWREPLHDTMLWLPFPAVGIAGALVGCLRANDPGQRRRRTDYLVLVAAATATALTLERAGAFANVLAIPGALELFRAARQRLSRLEIVPLRALGTTIVLLALMPFTSPLLSLLAPRTETDIPPAQETAVNKCMSNDNLARLDALPQATIMTPLNIGPNLITETHHRVIGSGYHRNSGAIRDVLLFFMAKESVARAVALRRHLDFVFLCPAEEEVNSDRNTNPEGLSARLAEGRPPAWLRPVTLPGLAQAKLYAVIR